VTDDSAFKKQVRARMAETGEKYTVARRMVIAEHDPGQPPVVLRVYLNPHVDLELTAEAARAYAAADEQGRREMAARLLADHIEAAEAAGTPGAPEASGSEEARVAAGSKIVTDQQVRTEAEDAAIRGAVQRSIERAVGLSAVEVDFTADRVHVTIRAARPGVAWGFLRAPETEGAWREPAAEQLREELEELTGKQVRLDILQAPGPQDTSPENAGPLI